VKRREPQDQDWQDKVPRASTKEHPSARLAFVSCLTNTCNDTVARMRNLFLCLCAPLLGALLVASCSDTGENTTSASSNSSSSGSADKPCVDDSDCTVGFNLICASTDDGACGPTTKKCIEYPPSCGEGTFTTVCGCDGKSHAKGPCPSDLPFQIDTRAGACPPAAGTFWCGNGACSVGAEYCVEGDMSVDCMALPANCMGAQATCTCLGSAGMTGCGCVDEPGGGIRINGCGI
jgi:hypothetical protein